jgi:hypothetical protein
MAEYRVYCLDGAGQISLAEWIEAEGDDDAIAQAREMEHGGIKCEVWRGGRLVARLGRQDLWD